MYFPLTYGHQEPNQLQSLKPETLLLFKWKYSSPLPQFHPSHSQARAEELQGMRIKNKTDYYTLCAIIFL